MVRSIQGLNRDQKGMPLGCWKCYLVTRKEVGECLSENFVSAWKKEGSLELAEQEHNRDNKRFVVER